MVGLERESCRSVPLVELQFFAIYYSVVCSWGGIDFDFFLFSFGRISYVHIFLFHGFEVLHNILQ